MPKFYRYLIYSMTKHYSKNSDSLFKVIMMVSMVHGLQFLTLISILSFVFEISFPSIFDSKIVFYPIAIIFLGLNFLVFYDKNKVKLYFDEFEQSETKYKKRLNFFVILYVFGSVILFFVHLPLLYGI